MTKTRKDITAEELYQIRDFISDNLYLIEYTQVISFAVNLSDFLRDNFNIDIFDDYHREIKNKIKQHILNNLHALDAAIIRLYEHDKKALKKLTKDLSDLKYKRYIRKTIKNRKFYER